MLKFSRSWYWLAWCIAAVAAVWLYLNHTRPETFIGLVEKKRINVSYPLPGTIDNLTIKIGDTVQAGQLIAEIQHADIEPEFERLQVLGNLLGLQMDLSDELVELEVGRVEVAGLNLQVTQLKKAQAAGLAEARELSALIVRRDVAQKRIREKIRIMQEQLGPQDLATTENQSANGEPNLYNRQIQRLAEFRDQLNKLVELYRSGKVVAPSDGSVVEILNFPGEAISAFTPIAVVEATPPTHLEAFVPERYNPSLAKGLAVSVISERQGVAPAPGTVVFVHPGYSPMPDRFMVNGIRKWARNIYIELDSNHQLLPGEKVTVKLLESASVKTAATEEDR